MLLLGSEMGLRAARSATWSVAFVVESESSAASLFASGSGVLLARVSACEVCAVRALSELVPRPAAWTSTSPAVAGVGAVLLVFRSCVMRVFVRSRSRVERAGLFDQTMRRGDAPLFGPSCTLSQEAFIR